MPESHEGRELRGLARSIDALFTRPSPPEAPAVGEVSPAESDAPLDPVDALWDAPAPPEEVSLDLASWGAAEMGEHEVGAEPDSAEAGADVAVAPVAAEVPTPPVDLPADVPADLPADEAPAAAVASGPGTAEVGVRPLSDLARAIEAHLNGDAAAADQVRSLARGLRERLALDPLADAVERLALAAGEPPDASILDLAGDVINPAVASRIVQRIGHERDEERKAVYTQISCRLGRVMALAFKGALTDTSDELARRSYYDNLIAMGEVSRPIIEGMVQDENRVLVRNGVAILGEIGGAGAAELVTTALADTDARVRREALLSLAKVGDESAGQLVLGFLEDSDADVRSAAAVAVGDLKVVRAQRRLIAMLDETSEPDALVPVLRALGQLGDPGAVQAIEKHAIRTLFSKPHAEVRIAAYQALQRIGTPHAKQLILAALTDKEPAVQAAVKRLMRTSERPEPAT
ncbi:MAG: HEAT repeat domain-containing protein [Gemmatimonadota bacterium]